MSRTSTTVAQPRTPSYRRQKVANGSDLAFVEVKGQRTYLGAYDTPASREAYDRFIAEYLGNGRKMPDTGKAQQYLILELVHGFWQHAKQYYTRPDGTVTPGLDHVRYALRPLKKLYSHTPAAEFGPKKLKVIRDHLMAQNQLHRKTINERVEYIRRVFKWGVANELVPANVYHALTAVEGLRKGRCSAKDSTPIGPVDQQHIDAVKPYVSRQVWDLIQLQLLTGARPGELVGLRPCDIDTSGKDVWVARLVEHKTAHHNKIREVYFGKQAQAILRQYITPDRPVHVPLFSPKEAEADRRAKLHTQRTTPLSCGNRPATNNKIGNRIGDSYTAASYRQAIARACGEADRRAKGGRIIGNDERVIPRWHPHQLRHNRATYLRQQYGIEVARVILGHSTLDATEIYAAADREKARKVMAEVG
jgi:integrase